MQGYVKLVERKGSPLFWSLAMRAFNQYFYPAMGLQHRVKDYRYENCTHYISTADLDCLTALVKQSVSTRSNYWSWYFDRSKELGDLLVRTAQRLSTSVPSGNDVRRLAEGFEDFTEASKNIMPFLVSTSILERLFEAQLRQTIQQEPSVARGVVDGAVLLAELRASAAPNAPIQEIRECYRLTRLINNDEGLKRALLRATPEAFIEELRVVRPEVGSAVAKHVQVYGWLNTYAYRFEPMRQADLVERMRTLVKMERIPQREQRTGPADLTSILRQKPTAQLRDMAVLLEQLVAVRFYRSTVHWRADTIARPFFHALAACLHMSRDDLIFCTEDEILSGLRGTGFPSLDDLQLRQRNGYSMSLVKDSIKVNTNSTPSTTVAFGLPVTLRGSTASKGRVVGRARVVLSADDRREVREGDIVVTTMTTPDFMDALEKCAGIVTDEGGILCHAAVISRELSVPCIIGTGDASHILRDDMTVEMDATQAEGAVACVHDAGSTDGITTF